MKGSQSFLHLFQKEPTAWLRYWLTHSDDIVRLCWMLTHHNKLATRCHLVEESSIFTFAFWKIRKIPRRCLTKYPHLTPNRTKRPLRFGFKMLRFPCILVTCLQHLLLWHSWKKFMNIASHSGGLGFRFYFTVYVIENSSTHVWHGCSISRIVVVYLVLLFGKSLVHNGPTIFPS